MSARAVRPSSPAVSALMGRVRRRDTAPEVALRRVLHRAGVRFRLDAADLPGRPDSLLVRARVAVFVDGCFWHGCPEHVVQPKANREFWADKIRANRQRDRRTDRALADSGWRAFHVWEHEEPAKAAVRLRRLWRRSGTASGGRNSSASASARRTRAGAQGGERTG